jgi:hypothetical protein
MVSRVILKICSSFAIIFLMFLVGQELKAKKAIPKKTNEAIALCSSELTRVLTDLKSKGDDLSALAKLCYSHFPSKECKDLNSKSNALAQMLDGKDLGLRWQYFSCSPLLYSKLRQLKSRADNLAFLTTLKKTTEDLIVESKLALEPGMFIENNMIDSQKRCCGLQRP